VAHGTGDGGVSLVAACAVPEISCRRMQAVADSNRPIRWQQCNNHGLDVNDVVEHIQRSQEMEREIEITPREVAELFQAGKIKLLDVRTPQEYQIAAVAGSLLVDQELAQEIVSSWPKDEAIVTMCHHGVRSLDAAAYLRGHVSQIPEA